jgi:hypothetical protein
MWVRRTRAEQQNRTKIQKEFVFYDVPDRYLLSKHKFHMYVRAYRYSVSFLKILPCVECRYRDSRGWIYHDNSLLFTNLKGARSVRERERERERKKEALGSFQLLP